MLWATAGFGLFVLVGVSSVRAARRRLSYETWYGLHLYAYLAIALAFLHQLFVGADFMHDQLAAMYWIGLYVVTAALVLTFRVGQPLVTSVASPAPRLRDRRRRREGVVSVYLAGRDLDRLAVRSGQYFVIRFLTRDGWWRAHPFSISSAPNGRWLRFTVKDLGDDSRRIGAIPVGTRVFVEGPYGMLTGARRTRRGVTLIAGGIGITPLRALLESLPGEPGDLTLIYRATTRRPARVPDGARHAGRAPRRARSTTSWDRGAQGSRGDRWPARRSTPPRWQGWCPRSPSRTSTCAVRQGSWTRSAARSTSSGCRAATCTWSSSPTEPADGQRRGLSRRSQRRPRASGTANQPDADPRRPVHAETRRHRPRTDHPRPRPAAELPDAGHDRNAGGLGAVGILDGLERLAGAAPTTSPSGGTSSGGTTAGGTAANGTTSSSGSTTATGPEVDTRYGPVQVSVTVVNGQVTDVTALELPSGGRSGQISREAEPILHDEALSAQSASIDGVSGATYTSLAYEQSLQAALDAAGLHA